MAHTDTANPARPVILGEATTDLYPELVWRHLGQWLPIRLGARDRLYSHNYVQFDVTAGRRKRRVIITLAPADTYSVEVGRVGKVIDGCPWTSRGIARGVHAEQLRDTVERLAVEALES